MTWFAIDIWDAFMIEGFLFGVLTTLLCLLINYLYRQQQKIKVAVNSTVGKFKNSTPLNKSKTVVRRQWK